MRRNSPTAIDETRSEFTRRFSRLAACSSRSDNSSAFSRTFFRRSSVESSRVYRTGCRRALSPKSRRALRPSSAAVPDDLFRSFDPIPIATASLAQVHAAVHADGRRVGGQSAARRHRTNRGRRPRDHPTTAAHRSVLHRRSRHRVVSSGDQSDDRRGAGFRQRSEQHRADRA